MPFKLGNGKPETIQKPLIITSLTNHDDPNNNPRIFNICPNGNCNNIIRNPSITSQNTQETPKVNQELHPIHQGGSEQQKIVDYAWDISHNRSFVYLLKAENGTFDPNRKSTWIGANGYRDYGLCQINKGFHPEIVNNPKFFTNWKWQLDQCYSLYKGGTVFYGAKNESKMVKYFKWVS